MSYWQEAHTADGIARRAPLAHITALADGISQSLMLHGHTHVPRTVRLADGRLVVNPGSVGCPGFVDSGVAGGKVCAGTPFASYAILDQNGTAWSVTHRLIPYDTAPAVTRARGAGFDDWAQVLATGWL